MFREQRRAKAKPRGKSRLSFNHSRNGTVVYMFDDYIINSMERAAFYNVCRVYVHETAVFIAANGDYRDVEDDVNL